MNDTGILDLLWSRDETALDVLSCRFGRQLHRIAANILGSAQDAEEAVNDTYLALWNAIPPAKPDPLDAYVYKVGRNTALKHLRRSTAKKRDPGYTVCLEELSQVLPGGSLEEAVDARLLGQAINRFLDTLNQKDRVLFLRRYWFGDDADTLCKILGLTQSNLSVRLYRIRTKLKAYLKEEGF